MRTPGLRLSRNAAAVPGNPAHLRKQAEDAAARLPAIMVAAERVAATVAQGVHGRRRVGPGETFWQFQRYRPGDPTHRIDWRQSAKRQHVYTRENEWDAAESVWLWRDGSTSMRYSSNPERPDKAERATVLALALTSLLIRAGERVALLGASYPPSSGRAVMERFAVTLTESSADQPSLPAIESLPRYARMVMISDLLSPPDELENVVRAYAAQGVRGHLVQVVDPAEDTLPFSGRVRFEGMEDEGAALIGRVEAVRADYVTAMENHRQAVADLARAVGWSFARHRTDHAPQTALLALYEVLSETPVD